MKYLEFDSHAEFVEASVNFIESVLAKNPNAAIGLSGGNTPKPIYTELARRLPNGVQPHFISIDERYITKGDTDSNQHMIQNAFSLATQKGVAKIIAFDTSVPILESLTNFENDIKHLLPLDLVILGMGPDGHIASIFPSSKALQSERLVAHTTTDVFAVHDRLTVTLPVILGAKKILLILSGDNKKDALAKLQHANIFLENFPAKSLLDHKDVTIYFSKV